MVGSPVRLPEVFSPIIMTYKYNLGFISDEDIYEHVKSTVEAYRREITLDQFNENIIDPIKLTFDAKVYGKSIQQGVEDECFRQIDKSNTNRIGYFHQNLFRYAVMDGLFLWSALMLRMKNCTSTLRLRTSITQ